MKIVVALSRFPYPTDKGDKLRAYHQIRDLSQKHEIFLVCLTHSMPEEKDLNHVRAFCKELIIIHRSLPARFFSLLAGIFSAQPFQVHFFRSSKMKKAIERIIKEHQIDICYVQLIRLIENIPFDLNVKYYLDFMDAFSAGMNKRVSLSRWYERFMISIEAKRLKHYEKRAFDLFNGYSIISKADGEALGDTGRLDILINGVNEKFLQCDPVEKKEYDVIFTGNMGYHPNIQACKYLVKEVLPELRKSGTSVKICLAGTSPSQEVLSLQSKDVVVTGYVEDITVFLAKSKIFVAPLFSGSGLQNKLLESMAVGLPSITTPLANKALMACPDKEILIANNKKEFADKIQRLLKDSSEADAIGKCGRSFIANNYQWSETNKKLEGAFEKLIKET
ncbi:MAG: glycosyltransferase [Cytophagaceae bacterium]